MTENNFEKNKLSKEEKKALKEKQKAEKLAKLAKKQAAISFEKQNEQKPKEIKGSKNKSKGYNPKEVEEKWTDFWIKNKTYEVENKHKDNFCMVIPPPNITGSLHIGHAMMVAIEDAIVRYKRLNKHNVLYLPGLDHAGIATQSVVMKKLAREGKDISKVTREEFLKEAHDWSNLYGHRIIDQFNRLGASLDFSKQVFTLEPKVVNSVTKAFVELHKRSLIYRENKIVNWSGKLKTTLSDLEVNYKEIKGGEYIEVDGKKHQMAMMYYVKYFLVKNKKEAEDKINQILQNASYDDYEVEMQKKVYCDLPYVLVGTTRPETILGDSALCINPNDMRFKDINGIFKNKAVEDVYNLKNINLNSINNNISENNTDINLNKEINNTDINLNKEIKNEKRNKYKTNSSKQNEKEEIKKFPFYAINPLTYEIIDVIADLHADLTLGTGILKVTPAHDPIDFALGKKHSLPSKVIMDKENKIAHSFYKDMKRLECREKVRKHPCIVKEEKRTQILPFCSRSNDLVEPMLKAQWWMKCDTMAQRAIDAVKSEEIEMHPPEAKCVWYRWLENIKDWCLSRQLWWGHRIPAYKYYKEEDPTEEHWVVAESEAEASAAVVKKEGKAYALKQDEDVLDTWFSSGLWPFSTLGWGWLKNNNDSDKNINDNIDNDSDNNNNTNNNNNNNINNNNNTNINNNNNNNDNDNDNNDLLSKFFPNSMLETGSDILFFWVARMVMLSYTLLNKPPFKKILLHGIVRDAHGQKMSKSLGNVIDPIYVIDGISQSDLIKSISCNVSDKEKKRAEQSIRLDYPSGIPQCGADALRFTLLSYTNKAKDINLDILRVAGYSRLCNKIYNAYKFIDQKINSSNNIILSNFNIINNTLNNINNISDSSILIINQFNDLIDDQHRHMESYNFMALTQSLHKFILNCYCDVYIEDMKSVTNKKDIEVMVYVYVSFLKLLHPSMPFITQEIYSRIVGEDRIIEDYPEKIILKNLINKK
ncbi:valine--tRNA [Ecytonucleospora hepatopenaei]|uniref:valine--tRNA ligase n=1 Tax=Ecytonucleospora hepatopenaei TaxID=646526 RepID=A0A1W0E4A5_9MICR|nr:valine--tRNA [Ecytonucleospora hepatopenaei]